MIQFDPNEIYATALEYCRLAGIDPNARVLGGGTNADQAAIVIRQHLTAQTAVFNVPVHVIDR